MCNLYLVLTNSVDRVSQITTSATVQSDHHLLSYNVKDKSNLMPNYNQADWMGLNSHLLDTDFSPITSSRDVNSLLCNSLANACHQFIPKVKIPCNPSPACLVLMEKLGISYLNKIRSLRRVIRKKPTKSNQSKLLDMESTLEKLICSSKERHIPLLINSFASSTKKLYRYLKNLKKPVGARVFVNTR